MTLDLYKAQARRLQAFLKSHPEHAQALGQAKHASCLEAVAHVHGARNWNTLQAQPGVLSEVGARNLGPDALNAQYPQPSAGPSAVPSGNAPALSCPPDALSPVFSGMRGGEVQYCYGTSGVGKSYNCKLDLVDALAHGYGATVLDVGRSYHHLALAFSGASTIPEQALTAPRLANAVLAAFEFEGWLLTSRLMPNDTNPVPKRWAQVLPFLLERQGRGHVLVVDELPALLTLLAGHTHLLVDFLVQARERGSLVVVLGQTLADFEALRERLPPTLCCVKKAPKRTGSPS